MLVNMGWDNLVVHDCELVTALITLFKKFRNIITEISIYALVLDAASKYLDDFLESNSRHSIGSYSSI